MAARGTAWVESPLQLVGALEAAARGLLGDAVDVVIRSGLAPLEDLERSLGSASLPPGVTLRRGDRVPVPHRTGAWGVGDPYSGRVQTAVVTHRRPAATVVVDDGLATLHLLRALTSTEPGPLVRPRATVGPARRVVGSAVRRSLVRRARAGSLTVCTAIDVPTELAVAFTALGGALVTHAFDWSGTVAEVDPITDGELVVGSALATDQLVEADAYLGWVSGIAQAASGPLAYVPHRRESTVLRDAVAQIPGVVVRPSPWPIEVRLRSLAAGSRVHCLPSTPLVTLRASLGPRGVDVVGTDIPDAWWTPGAPASFREHLLSSTAAPDEESAA